MEWPNAKLRMLSTEQLNNLRERALERDVIELVDRIDASGLLEGKLRGIALESSIGKQMARVVNSETAVKAGIAAAEGGKPLLQPIERLLFQTLGAKYSRSYEAGIQAGYLTAMKKSESEFTFQQKIKFNAEPE
jgi:hypothetical protein